jgi:hypothetical protein
MEPIKPELEKYEKQYLITDVDGNITNVTEGLNYELGFFEVLSIHRLYILADVQSLEDLSRSL